MSCVTVNSTPIPSVAASTASSQNIITGASTIASGNMTTQSTISTPMPLTTQNSISPAINVNMLPPDSSAQVHQVLTKQRLQDLVREVDPNVQPDEDVEELLLQIAEGFIDDVVSTSCFLAKHRKSSVLEVKDVQLSLEKNWNLCIPGFGSEEVRPYKKSFSTEAHKQRMALIRKTLKK